MQSHRKGKVRTGSRCQLKALILNYYIRRLYKGGISILFLKSQSKYYLIGLSRFLEMEYEGHYFFSLFKSWHYLIGNYLDENKPLDALTRWFSGLEHYPETLRLQV